MKISFRHTFALIAVIIGNNNPSNEFIYSPCVVQWIADSNISVHGDCNQVPNRHTARDNQDEESQQTKVFMPAQFVSHVEGKVVRQRQSDKYVRQGQR